MRGKKVIRVLNLRGKEFGGNGLQVREQIEGLSDVLQTFEWFVYHLIILDL